MLRAILAQPGNTATVLAWNFQMKGPHAMKPLSTPEFCKLAPAMQVVVDALPASERTVWQRRVSWMGNWYTKFPVPIEKAHLNAAILNAGADLFVCLQDIFMFQPGPFACPAVMWMPLHFAPAEKATVRALADFDVLVGISGYGAEMLTLLFGAHHGASAFKHVEWIPHGRDASVFKPAPHQLDASDKGVAMHRAFKRDLRVKLGWPVLSDAAGSASAPLSWADAPGGDGAVHITLMVASNSEESGRKAYDAQIQAWVAFAERRARDGFPRDATFLVIHAEVTRAYDLGRLLETFGEFPERHLYEDMADRRGLTRADALTGIRGARFLISPASKLGSTSDADMAAMFQAADVLLAASTSEGCGVPILEAQLCGCPVVTNHTTAMPEQTLYGVSAPVGQYIARVDFNSGWFLPSVTSVAAALYDTARWSDTERAERLAAALPTVVERYDAKPVVAAWDNLFRRVDRDVVGAWRAGVKHAVALPLGLCPPPSRLPAALSPARALDAHAAHATSSTLVRPSEPWRAPDFGAWLKCTASTLGIAMPAVRALSLVATRTASEYESAASQANNNVLGTARIREMLARRLNYVRSALQEVRTARAELLALPTTASVPESQVA
jgi:glycosyltransferase involved in cell wall biosynthesis